VTTRLHPALALFALALALVLVGPTLIVAIMSFSKGILLYFPPQGFSLHWYREFLGNDIWMRAMGNSVRIGGTSALIAASVGTIMALGLVRGRFVLQRPCQSLVLGPLVVPPIVLAIGLYFTFSRWHLVGTYSGLIAAHAVLGLPFVVLVVSSGLRTLDRTLEQAAYNLGAGPVRTFLRITLPLMLPSILVGALFAFITSWDDVIVAYFLASPLTRTLPVVMWAATRESTNPTLAAVATFLSTVSTALLLVLLLRKGKAVAWAGY
jgi:putative spermidine/putrescine transport system permease protein